VSKLDAELLAGGLELAAHAADTARPGVFPERVDHRSSNAAFRKGFELDAAAVVEPVSSVDQTDHAVLHQIAQINRMWHRRRHASSQCLDEVQPSLYAVGFCGRLTHSFAHPPNPGSGSPAVEATPMPALCTGVEDWAICRPNFVSL
jgi:hypothetical protein